MERKSGQWVRSEHFVPPLAVNTKLMMKTTTKPPRQEAALRDETPGSVHDVQCRCLLGGPWGKRYTGPLSENLASPLVFRLKHARLFLRQS